jgi:hypothetical protein
MNRHVDGLKFLPFPEMMIKASVMSVKPLNIHCNVFFLNLS